MTSCRRPGFGYTRATTILVLSAMMCPFLKATFCLFGVPRCSSLYCLARPDNSAGLLVSYRLVRTAVAARSSAIQRVRRRRPRGAEEGDPGEQHRLACARQTCAQASALAAAAGGNAWGSVCHVASAN